MLYDILDKILTPQIIVMVLAAISGFATVMTLAMPALARDRINARMKVMATERDKMRASRISELNKDKQTKLRSAPKGMLAQIVDQLNLRKAFDSDEVRDKLRMAGYRGQAELVFFLFARAVLPIVFFALALLYLFGISKIDQPTPLKFGIALIAAYVGFYAPVMYVSNLTQKRQKSIKRAWPDALDLMLICVESGMSVESAFRKVSEEIGVQSVELAEELMLTTAELSFLPERRQAYENLGTRTGLEGVRAVMTSLIQAERYGTPVGTALRVMAQENRDQRMTEAEKKAAALPPKLTVPMIVFFLPVLFLVILGPAAIRFWQMP